MTVANRQDISRILWEPKVHYCVHNSPTQVPILRQMNQSTPTQTISLTSILILSFHLRLGLPSGLFPTKISYSFPNYAMCATCPAYRNLLHFLNLIIYGEE